MFKPSLLRAALSGVLASFLLPMISTSISAQERSCRDQFKVRSGASTTPTKITFVNTSGMYRSLDWIDFAGQSKSFGGLNGNETKTFNTFASHVWVVSTGPGDCLQMFIATAQPLIVELPRQAVDGPRPKTQPKAAPALVCADNYVKVRGACVPKQNCGAHAVRNREGDCACVKHYRQRNGRCVSAASTCAASEVYSSSVAQCIPRDLTPRPCPRGHYRNQLGQCQPNQTGG